MPPAAPQAVEAGTRNNSALVVSNPCRRVQTRMQVLDIALCATQLFAAALDPKLLNLIGPETRSVFGRDAARHRQSGLNKLLPAASLASQTIEITGPTGIPLSVQIGGGDTDSVILDNTTSIQGDQALIEEATRLWGRTDIVPTPLAIRAQQLAGMYDNWFVIVRPLEQGQNAAPLKYRAELVNAIEQISGGIRFGTTIEIRVEALMQTSDHARTLAALGHWLPGLVQLIQSEGAFAQLAEIAENISVVAEGRTVTLSFQLAEGKVKELADVMGSPMAGEPVHF
jgi:hypothetical protein